MKELDLVLQRWLRTGYERASPAQRADFEALLELPDPQLLRFLMGVERPADPRLAAAVDALATSSDIMSFPTAEPSDAAPLQLPEHPSNRPG